MAELDTDRIAAAALAVADKCGLEGFTMRAVAKSLGVTPMALYHHVKDKAALAALVVDAANNERPLPSPTGVWQEDLWAIARWTRESTLAHPGLMHLRRTYRVWTTSMLSITDRWLTLWQQSGLDLEQAILAATTSSMAIIGLVEEELAFRHMDIPKDKLFTWLPNARLVFKAKMDGAAQFELAVRALHDGLHARLQSRDKTSTSAKPVKSIRGVRRKRR